MENWREEEKVSGQGQLEAKCKVEDSFMQETACMDSSMKKMCIADFLEPSQANTFHQLGISHYKNGDFKESIIAFNKSVTLNPGNAVSYFYRGMANIALEEIDKAIMDFNFIIGLKEGKTLNYDHFGDALFYASNSVAIIHSALDYFNHEIELNPDNEIAYCHRGYIHFHILGDFELAIADYQHAINIAPKIVEAHKQLGFIYNVRKDFVNSLLYLNKALELEPTCALAYKYRADVYTSLKLNDLAIKDYNSYKTMESSTS